MIRSRSWSLSGAGAWRSPVQSAEMADTSSPRARTSAPSTCARGVLRAHQPGGGGFHTQRVPDDAGYGGAVLGAGETVALAPFAQGVGGGAAAGLDLGDDFDRGGDAGGGGHVRGGS